MKQPYSLEEVQKQYENYPYPPRDPNDEYKRLVMLYANDLHLINHYCFKGELSIPKKGESQPFRILVAGAGTGDSVIEFAEVLRDYNVEVTYLDISSASMEIAKKRAEVRGLDNIIWLHESLLEIPNLKLSKFDYINCVGVLHHLANPLEGLLALKSVLKKDGAMHIMVYAEYGRVPVYMMQELAKRINSNEANLQKRVENTKAILQNLPDRNWFKISYKRWQEEIKTDIGLYDLLLHSQDRAYTIPQLYEFIEKEGGLKIIEFIGNYNRNKIAYNPALYLPQGELLEKILAKPKEEQQAIAELIAGDMVKHSFYLSYEGEGSIASPENLELVPYFRNLELKSFIINNYKKFKNSRVKLEIKGRGYLELEFTNEIVALVEKIDGRKSIKEILNEIGKDSKRYFKSFKKLYYRLFQFELMLLKSKKFPLLLNQKQLQNRFLEKYSDRG